MAKRKLRKFIVTVEEVDVDVSHEIDCPRCGCNLVEALEYPRDPNGWFGRYGKARCNHCNAEFSIQFYNRRKKVEGASAGNTNASTKQLGQTAAVVSDRTSETIAKAHGISEKSVRKRDHPTPDRPETPAPYTRPAPTP